MGNLAVIHDEHHQRLETKLKRELGDQVLALLNDDRTENKSLVLVESCTVDGISQQHSCLLTD
jgi:hypothetical protein